MPEYKTFNILIDKVKGLRRKELTNLLTVNIMKIFIFCGAILLTAVLIEKLFWFTPGKRIYLFSAYMISLLAIAGFWCIPIINGFSGKNNKFRLESIALQAGLFFPNIKDRLLNAMQLYQINSEGAKNTSYSPDLILASINHASENYKNINFAQSIDKTEIFKYRKYFLVFIVIAGGIFSTDLNGNSAAYTRLLNPNTAYARPVSFVIDVLTKDIEVIKNEPLTITAAISGVQPEKLLLYTKNNNSGELESQIMTKSDSASYEFKFEKVKDSFEYYLSAEEENGFIIKRKSQSDTYKVSMIFPPQIRNLRIHLDYPAYSKIEDRDIEDNIGDITALKGTKAEFSISINKNIERGSILFSDSSRIKLDTNGRMAAAELTLTKSLNYKFSLIDDNGIENNFPIEYKINTLTDDHPFIEMLHPNTNSDLTEDKMQVIALRVSDDFGIKKMRLVYKILDGDIFEDGDEDKISNDALKRPKEFSDFNIPLNNKTSLVQDIQFQWDMTNLQLFPEDRIMYYAEVFDNDGFTGSKSSRTKPLMFRYPSLEELFEYALNSQDEQQVKLEDVIAQSKDLSKDLDEISREFKTAPDMDYEKQQKAEAAIKKQEEIQESVDEIKEQMDELVEKFENNDLLSGETLDKYKELQELFRELMSSEMLQAMQKLQQSMQESEDMQDNVQNMENFKAAQDEFTKKVERTLNILKRLQIEQTMDELVIKSENITETQENINSKLDSLSTRPPESTQAEKDPEKSSGEKSNINSSEEQSKLAKREEKLADSMKNLEETADRLNDKMLEMPDLSNEKLNQAIEQMKQNQYDNMMKELSKKMQSGDQKNAASEGKQMQAEMSELEEKIKEAQEELNKEQKDKIIKGLQKSAKNLLALSIKQESLLEKSNELTVNSGKFTESADIQQNIMTGLSKTISKLVELSEKSFFITPELGKELVNAATSMKGTLKNLEGRNKAAVQIGQNNSMTSLNTAALELGDAVNKAKDSKSGIGFEEFLKRMEQMAKQQGDINSMSLELEQGGKLTPEQQAGMQRLSQEQKMLQQSMQQLQDEMQGQQGMSDKLQNLTKEMEQVIQQMQMQKIDNKTLDIQKKILSRMLDAQKSLSRRDFSKKRQAEQAKNYNAVDPGQLPEGFGEGANSLEEMLNKALKAGYNKDFEDLIRKYFEVLNKKKDKNK